MKRIAKGKDRRSHDRSFLNGGGELGERIRAYDWTRTPLGPPEHWPVGLKTAVRIMLTSRQAMWIGWGPELTYLYNDPYKAIIGGKHPVALGEPTSIVWREIWDDIHPMLATALGGDQGTYVEAQLLIMERNGYPEETYYTFSYSPIPDDEGGAGGIICANTDDTERVVRERQLALLRQLAGAAAEARTVTTACELAGRALETDPQDVPFALIYLLDSSGQLSLAASAGFDANHPDAPATVGADADVPWPFADALRARGTRVVSNLRSRDALLPRGTWDRAPDQAVVVPLTARGYDRDAGLLVLGLNPYRLLDDAYRRFIDLVAGQISGGLANASAYEDERRRADMLAELDRAKTAFYSNVSHELRTPLTLMLGPVEEILSKPQDSFSMEHRELLAVVQRNGLRLSKLVNNLLDFSRLEAGRVQAHYEPTDLATLTADLASVFRSAIEKAGLRLVVDCSPVPEDVYVDREMWEKVVLNLLSNALKFTFDGQITVRLRGVGDGVTLSVSDTGTGIAAAELPHVFERFHRVRGARARTHEGTGIGLALVQELVRLHAGSIEAESTLGRGTTFTVTLPTGTAHLPADSVSVARGLPSTAVRAEAYVNEALGWASQEPASDDGREAASHEAARILVADDNADMRDYVSRLLGDRWRVEAVANGAAALTAIRERKPDLVLADVMMPELDGFELLRAVREDPSTRHTPVVLLSARAGEEATLEGIAAGADDYLVKPFTARDLIGRVEAQLIRGRERAIREEQRRQLYELFMQAPTLIVLLRGEQFIVDLANPLVCEVWARSLDEVINKPLFEALPEIRGQGLEELLQGVYRTGIPHVGKELPVLLNRQGNGTLDTVYFDFVYTPYKSAGGVVEGVFVVASDVTHQVIARRAVEEAYAQVEHASRVKDEFLATLSHELRTPLNAILGWSQMLRAGAMQPEVQKRALDSLERNAKAQAQLVEELLDVSRIISGKLAIKEEAVSLPQVISSAIDTVKPAASAKRLHVTANTDIAAVVTGDFDRLQQIVWNLLSNAVKFTPAGGRVDVELTTAGGRADIVVKDTGQGIDPAFMPYVFERFRQADSGTARLHGGLGLGLAIVRHLAEAHGGTVRAESEGAGLGATFIVSLPVRTGAVPEAVASMTESRGEPELAGTRALIVDDEADARELMRYILETRGAQVATATSAGEALHLFTQQRFDILVADIGMPGQDGYSFIRAVRSLPESQGGRVPAIAVTAYASIREREHALEAGFNWHLSKPVEPDQLLAAVAAGANLTSETRREPS